MTFFFRMNSNKKRLITNAPLLHHIGNNCYW